MTARPRLPTFIIVGAPKCGTTSLWAYLAQHPQVHMAPIKEPRWFMTFDPAFDPRKQPPAASSQAAYAALFAAAGSALAVGEATPLYLYSEPAARAIASTIPDVRIVIALRSPVDRAISAYSHARRRGLPVGSPDQALTKPTNYFVDRSRYSRHVATYLTLFGPDRVHVVLAEDLSASPQPALSSLCAFLGVDPTFVFDTHERLNCAPDRATVSEPTLRALAAALAPDVRSLEHLLSRSLDVWRPTPRSHPPSPSSREILT